MTTSYIFIINDDDDLISLFNLHSVFYFYSLSHLIYSQFYLN